MLRAMRLALGIVIVLAAACSGSSSSKPAVDATAHGFLCGNAVCGEGTQYCFRYQSGVTAPVTGCNDLPAACAAAPSCGCLTANVTASCGALATCSAQGPDLTLSCANP